MSGDAIRAALTVFDDAALEALSNKGVVRRSAKDVEAGKVGVTEESDTAITVLADGETVVLDVQGPRGAKCSCPAPGICRHKIAAVLCVRGTSAEALVGQGDTASANAEASQADPLAEILALDSGAIAKWAGKANLRAAAELLAASSSPEIRQDGAALVIRVLSDEPEVRYLSGQGLEGMVSKATPARLKSSHAAALLAVRRAHNVAESATIADAEVKASSADTPDPEFLAQVAHLLESAAFAALNQAPLVLEEQLFTLSISSRADALPRLSRQLRLISTAFRQKRERAIAFDPLAALSLLANTYALVEALGKPQEAEALAMLRGVVRQDYIPVGDLTLYGLGANLWRTQTGAHGVTGYFYAAELERILTATLARAADRDPSFNPAMAYSSEGLWHAGTLERLTGSKVALKNAAISPDGRLSFAGDISGTAEPWQGTRTQCSEWPIYDIDWQTVERSLQAQFHEQLAIPRPAAVPMLFAPSFHSKVTFDVQTQKHIWHVADADGRWVNLEFRQNDSTKRAVDLLHLSVVQLVLAEARAVGSRFVLTPISVVLQSPSRNDNELLNFEIAPYPQKKKTALPEQWYTYLAEKPEGALPVANVYAAVNEPSVASKHCADCMDALLSIAELGIAQRSTEYTQRLGNLATRAETLGLVPLADVLAALLKSQGDTPHIFAKTFFRAVHVTIRMQARMRSLA
jgi:hypothetical protein